MFTLFVTNSWELKRFDAKRNILQWLLLENDILVDSSRAFLLDSLLLIGGYP